MAVNGSVRGQCLPTWKGMKNGCEDLDREKSSKHKKTRKQSQYSRPPTSLTGYISMDILCLTFPKNKLCVHINSECEVSRTFWSAGRLVPVWHILDCDSSRVALDFVTLSYRYSSGNACCLLMRMKRYRSIYGIFLKIWKISEHVILSHPELAFGKPKRDSRPALQKCTPMMSFVFGAG